jgi:hypothetical protein
VKNKRTYAKAIAMQPHPTVQTSSSPPLPPETNSKMEFLLETLIRQQEDTRQQNNKVIELLTMLISKLIK